MLHFNQYNILNVFYPAAHMVFWIKMYKFNRWSYIRGPYCTATITLQGLFAYWVFSLSYPHSLIASKAPVSIHILTADSPNKRCPLRSIFSHFISFISYKTKRMFQFLKFSISQYLPDRILQLCAMQNVTGFLKHKTHQGMTV